MKYLFLLPHKYSERGSRFRVRNAMTDVKITSKDPKIKEDRCDLAGCHTIIARGLRPIPAYLFTVRDPENIYHQM